jgi:flagellar hook-length control protein FliK
MPPTVLHLSSATSSTRSTAPSNTTSRIKDDSTPSPFDNTLRDASKPKTATAKPAAKPQPPANPGAKKAAKSKPTGKPDPSAPAPKKSEVHDEDPPAADRHGDPNATAEDQTAQDSATQDKAPSQDQSKSGDASSGAASAIIKTTTATKAPAPDTKAAAPQASNDRTQQSAKADKTAKRPVPVASETTDPAAAQVAVATQSSQQKIPSPTSISVPSTTGDGSSQAANAGAATQDLGTPTGNSPTAHAAAVNAADTSDSDSAETPTGATSDDDSAATEEVATSSTAPADSDSTPTAKSASDLTDRLAFAQALASHLQEQQPAQAAATAKPAAEATNTPASLQAQFSEANHPQIVSDIQGKLLPDGGTMNLRLNPPELGTMHVRVEVRDGVISASFSAEKDQTAKLLSHSLGDLKTSLEAQGITVEKLHVTQLPKDSTSTQSQSNGQRGSQAQQKTDADAQGQQRREMLQRMWKKLMKGSDPLDLMA